MDDGNNRFFHSGCIMVRQEDSPQHLPKDGGREGSPVLRL